MINFGSNSTENSQSIEKHKKKTVNDFEFGEIMGEGAFGDVIMCVEKRTQRKFAAKKIQKMHLIRTNNAKYAILERDILIKCNHPNIIKLYYTLRDTENLYFILELAPNGDLLGLIKKFHRLSLELTRFYAAEIISALEHMRSLNIVHRDLKPENILISSTRHAKITDFGTAKILEKNEVFQRSNSFVGTAEYIAPELLNTERQILTPCVDLWALGCIIFQMLTGNLPFRGMNQFLTFEAIQRGKYSFPAYEIDPHAKDLIEKLLVRDPNARIGSKSIDEIKSHPFFASISWDSLENTDPPEENHISRGRKFQNRCSYKKTYLSKINLLLRKFKYSLKFQRSKSMNYNNNNNNNFDDELDNSNNSDNTNARIDSNQGNEISIYNGENLVQNETKNSIVAKDTGELYNNSGKYIDLNCANSSKPIKDFRYFKKKRFQHSKSDSLSIKNRNNSKIDNSLKRIPNI